MKRVLIGLAILLLALAALALSVVLGLSRFALPWLAARIHHDTGYQIVAESMDFHFRRGIILEDLRVLSPEKKEVFTASRFYLRPRWKPLIRERQLVIDEVSVDTPDGRISGRGVISKEWDADVRVEFRANKARPTAPPAGILTAQLVKGRGGVVARISHGALQVSAIAQINVPDKQVEATLRTGRYSWKPGVPQPWDLQDLTVRLKGNLSRWRVQALTHFHKPGSLRYSGSIEKLEEEAGWKIYWDSIALHLAPNTEWRTTRPGMAVVNQKGDISIPDLAMSDGTGQLQGAAHLGKKIKNVQLKANKVLAGPLIAWAYPERGIQGTIDGTVDLQGSVTAPTGKIDVAISSGLVKGVMFQHIQGRIRLEPPWIIVEKIEMEVPQTGKNVTGSGRLPWHLVQKTSPNLPMDLRFQTADTDPRFLSTFMPGVEIEAGGHLGVQAVVQGRYPDVTVEGQATLQAPRVRYPSAGVDFSEVELALKSQGKHAEITQGKAKLGKGTIQLSGKVIWPKLDITLVADKATFLIPKNIDLKTDARIHLGGHLEAPELTGEIRPKDGTYTVPRKDKKDKDKEKDEKEAPEAKKPAEETSETWKALTMDIRTVWDHGMWYRDGLTKIETAADLKIRKRSGSPDVALVGPLTLIRGSYDAYGKDFVIDSGDINFTGGSEINPIISIQANYRTPGYTVYLSVSGNLKPAPRLKFTSSPPLTEQEIISLLVTGRVSSSLSGTSGSDDQAKAAAADVASSYLTRSLRESGLNLGLDVVRVTPSATGTVWTVGRYLGPDLFVSYGQNPKDSASSVVNADYSLSKRWSLATQASSTSDTFVDLLFRYPLKRRESKPEPKPEPEPSK
jgi:autotransporter translocation and assembly factor TamB